jgi:hypothetical protein
VVRQNGRFLCVALGSDAVSRVFHGVRLEKKSFSDDLNLENSSKLNFPGGEDSPSLAGCAT